MTRFRLLFIITLALISCHEESSNNAVSEDPLITIAGKFKDFKSTDSIPNITLFFQDYITKQIGNIEQQVDSSGQFSFNIELSKQQDIMLAHQTILHLIVKPGDSLFLELSPEDLDRQEVLKSIHISGRGAVINQNLLQFLIDDPVDYNSYRSQRMRLNPTEFKSYRDSVFNSQSKFINNYIQYTNYSEELNNWLEAQMLYGLADSYSFFEIYLPKDSNDIVEGKYNLNNIEDVEFKHYINTIASNKIPKKLLDYNLISNQQAASNLNKEERSKFYLDQIASMYQDKPELVKLITNDFIKSNLNLANRNLYESNRNYVDDLLSNTIFEASLKSMYQELLDEINNPNLSEKIQLLDYTSTDISGLLKEIVANAEGKPIYIDNWATWCSPCIQEFKQATPSLMDALKDKVEFVFLCYKSDLENWKTTISKYNLEGKHYFINENQADDLKLLLSINGFPTYSIINSTGELIHSESKFRPSNQRTLEILEELSSE